MLYVVLGNSGEYSDRAVWISGIFKTEEQARAAIETASTARREYDLWHERYLTALHGPDYVWKMGREYTDEDHDAAKLIAGPEPAHENGEYFQLVKVPLDEWGVFEEDWKYEMRREQAMG